MILLLILVILVLGYLYMESTPAEKARLGLSNGWVTYVLLGQHGLYFFIQGLVGYLLIWAILGVALLALHGLLLLGGAGLPWAWLGSLFRGGICPGSPSGHHCPAGLCLLSGGN